MEDNEPGLFIDLKCVLPLEYDRIALRRALKHKERWLGYFMDEVGEVGVRDIIEDLALKLRVCEEKLAREEKAHAVTMFENNVMHGLIEKNNGDVEDYKYE